MNGAGAAAEASPDRAQLAFAAITPGMRRYALFLFWLASLFSYLDRHIFSVLLEPIKAAFGFSDTELGLLGGFAFVGFYVLFAMPIARLSERRSRRNILAVSLAVWSLMAAACGLATGFLSLFAARAGVAIGEGGGAPAVQSLTADYFPPERRGHAFAVLGTGITFSIFTAYTLGGWLGQELGWRMTFVLIGLPGLVVALLVRLTLPEPERGGSEQRSAAADAPPFLATLGTLWARPAYRNTALGGALAGMGAWGSGLWMTSFLIRVHGLSLAQAGAALGLAYGIAGTAGTMIGGGAVDRLVRRGDQRWYMRVPALALLASLPLFATAFLATATAPALAALVCALFLMHVYSGPVTAMTQALAGLRMRATSTAFYYLIGSVISMGLGPLLVGAASDLFGVDYGAQALRYALLSVVLVAYGGAALFFWRASRSLAEDLAAAQRD